MDRPTRTRRVGGDAVQGDAGRSTKTPTGWIPVATVDGGESMETIAWIPLLPSIPGASEVPQLVAERDAGHAPEEAESSSDVVLPAPVADRADASGRRPVLQGCRWRSIALLAVTAAVVWGLAWRNEALRLASQRRGGERIASRPADPLDRPRSVVP